MKWNKTKQKLYQDSPPPFSPSQQTMQNARKPWAMPNQAWTRGGKQNKNDEKEQCNKYINEEPCHWTPKWPDHDLYQLKWVLLGGEQNKTCIIQKLTN